MTQLKTKVINFTKEDVVKYNQAAIEGTIEDEKNPIFILSSVNKSLLIEIAKSNMNMQELAKRGLENIGSDIDGNWVGFNHKIK